MDWGHTAISGGHLCVVYPLAQMTLSGVAPLIFALLLIYLSRKFIITKITYHPCVHLARDTISTIILGTNDTRQDVVQCRD